MSEENVVYIGNKPVMNYVLAAPDERYTEVILKASGKEPFLECDAAEISEQVHNRREYWKHDMH